MKQYVWLLPSAALLLCGCMGSAVTEAPAVTSAPERTQSEAAATPEQAAENAETESTVYSQTVPDALLSAGDIVLPYDEIRLASATKRIPNYYAEGYYTMSKDGKWGVMLSDGTELLPCTDSTPISACDQSGIRWHYSGSPTDAAHWDEYCAALCRQLQACCNSTVCGGAHDGWYYTWFYDTKNGEASLDGGMMLGNAGAVPTIDFEEYGAYLPCQRGHFAAAGTENNDIDCYVDDTPQCYVYANAGGALLNDQAYENAACFYDQPLAAAERNGKWLYLNTDGKAVTEAIYDGVYGLQEATTASPLLNGYAAVCRDGKWGLLDATGSETLLCEYAGTAWDGSTLWLKQNDGWHSYHLPGVEKPDRFSLDLPANITAPNYERRPGEQVSRITTGEGSLNLRAGPGTEYDKVGSIPPSTEIMECGLNYSDSGWVLTEYIGQYGWVSTQYLGWLQ